MYVGNYFDNDLQVFRTQGGTLKQVGANIKLGGQPASMRALPLSGEMPKLPPRQQDARAAALNLT